MNGLWGEVARAAAVGAGYLLIFAAAEAVKRRYPDKAETSRKTIHILGGLVALSFPYVFTSHWSILALATGFSLIIFVTKRLGALRSLHGVTRKSHGGLYYAAAIYLIFLLSRDTPVYYVIAMLVMTTSDALAALIGVKYGVVKYDVEGNTKSLEGSLTFFLATFLVIHLPLLLLTDTGRAESVMIALILALLLTGFEAISLSGSDNIFVPFGTYYLLGKFSGLGLGAMVEQLAILAAMVLIAAVLYIRPRLLRVSGLIAIILINYAAISLCSFYWLLALLLAQIMYYLLVINYARHVGRDKISSFQVGVMLYLGLVPTIYVFVSNTLRDYNTLFLPFVTAVAAHLAIICHDFAPFAARTLKVEQLAATHRLATALLSVVAATLFVALAPIHLYVARNISFALILVFVGITAAFFLNYLAEAMRGGGRAALDYRVRLGSAAAGSLLTLLLQQAIFQRGGI